MKYSKVGAPMYIRQADPIFFPARPNILPQFFFDKNLVLAPTPPKLRKKYFFIAFLSSLKLTLPAYVKK